MSEEKNGFFKRLFGKDGETKETLDLETMLQTAYNAINKPKESIKIVLQESNPSIFESKFGGLPYLPIEREVPTNFQGKPLRHLAQIRCDALPKNNLVLPSQGILQFWIEDNDLYGLDFAGEDATGGYRVVYYEDIDESILVDDIKERYQESIEEYFPINGSFGLRFKTVLENSPLEYQDVEELLLESWNALYPKHKRETMYDLGVAYDNLYNKNYGAGHKIGGYPYFTQSDPRSDEKEYDTLLLQIDTDGSGENWIMWGDSGVGNFFINEEKLKALDFSDVLYNWDSL